MKLPSSCNQRIWCTLVSVVFEESWNIEEVMVVLLTIFLRKAFDYIIIMLRAYLN